MQINCELKYTSPTLKKANFITLGGRYKVKFLHSLNGNEIKDIM